MFASGTCVSAHSQPSCAVGLIRVFSPASSLLFDLTSDRQPNAQHMRSNHESIILEGNQRTVMG